MKKTRALLAGLLVTLLSGCASFVAPAYSPDYPSVDRLKNSQLDKIAVGTFQPQKPDAPVNRITLRGTPLNPAAGTFATYLENAIRSDLKELGVLDPAARTRIDATLLQNDIDVSGFSKGEGTMEVRLTVSTKDAVVHEKVYLAKTQFESSFAGAVAIPRGQNEYPTLVRTLLQQVYSDPSFIQSVRKLNH